jgi:predicted lipoprotein with Yx(FWY)xxD motif
MFCSQGPTDFGGRGALPRMRRRTALLRAFALALGAVAVLSGVALAAGVAPTLSAARNAALKKTIVVDARGRAVYVLSPESIRHLLCTSKACFAVWPPVTVSSRSVKLTAGPGVRGHIALLRRSNGALQVTLRGLPLYTYVGDTAKGQAHGEGIVSFGGTWHAVPAG